MSFKNALRVAEPGSREANAFHEAGHALVSIDRGSTFDFVTIVPEKETLGRVEGGQTEVHKGYVNLNEVQTWLAGARAEEIACGKVNHTGAHDDYLHAARFVANIEDQPDLADFTPFELDLLEACSAEAERILLYSWPCVVAIVDQLLARNTLTESEVREICESVEMSEAMDKHRELYWQHADETGRLIDAP